MEHPKECTDTLEMNPKGMDTNELPEREMKIVILRKIDKRLQTIKVIRKTFYDRNVTFNKDTIKGTEQYS